MKLKERKKSRQRKPNMLGLQYYPWFGGYGIDGAHTDDDDKDDDDGIDIGSDGGSDGGGE